MKKLLYIFPFVIITGCTSGDSPVCTVGKVVSETAAAEIAVQLDCKNKQAIVDDMFKQLEGWGVCMKSQQSVIGDILCPRVVDSLVNGVFKQIPTAWGCTGGELKETAKQHIIDVCKKAI